MKYHSYATTLACNALANLTVNTTSQILLYNQVTFNRDKSLLLIIYVYMDAMKLVSTIHNGDNIRCAPLLNM